MRSAVAFLFIACWLLSCSALDGKVKRPARRQAIGRHRERPLFIARLKDSIVEEFSLRTNGYFEYISNKFTVLPRTGKARVRRIDAYHGAGSYRQQGDTIFLSYYKDYRPAYLTGRLFYSSDHRCLYYYYAADSSRKRELPIRKISLPAKQP